MKIYPKCEILKIGMLCCSWLGIFPWQFLFEDTKKLQRIYAIYSRLMLGYYIGFVISAYMQLYCVLIDNDLGMDAVSGNMCITFIYTITIARQLIIRFNPSFRSMIKQIIDNESSESHVDDPELDQIQTDCVVNCKFKSKLYMWILVAVTMQYIFRPLFVQPLVIVNARTNITRIIKPLPLSSWFPFDEQTHYLEAYLLQIIDSLIGASFVTYTDVFMFNLIVYPTGQLLKLQHLLKNFETYIQRFKVAHNISNDNDAAYFTFLDFINRHKDIIQFIDDFNETMGTLMVFDFLQSSLQIASIITQILGVKLTIVMISFVGTFFVSMILRLILYYYYATEVTILSEGLAADIWQSSWYEQTPKVKFMMLIFIMRAQKPLRMKIGGFSVMSLSSLISILKATYSYVMIMF